jgi:hypothetical protein
MTAKLSPKAALACNLLVFNALCIVVFMFALPFIGVLHILLGILNTLKEFTEAVIEENFKIVDKYKPTAKTKEIKMPELDHNSIGLN